jgi:surfeit locus 1 family protein
MTFRPYPGFTIFAAIMFAILCGLGVWQLERLQWKLALIARVNGHMTAAPIPAEAAMALGPDEVQYRRVALRGIFNHAQENYVFTTDAGGNAVYHVLTPFFVEESGAGSHWLMVDRGEVPKERLDPGTRKAGNIVGTARVIGVWRVPDAPGAFTPAPDMAHRIWYARDLAAMARADGIALKAPVVIEADATPNPGGWPKGGQTVVTFRNEHLSYAVTWFGLAAAMAGIWIAYHISKGRLSFK